MEHIEIHVMKSPHDVELAMVAGLLDEFEDTVELKCEVCDDLIHFSNTDPKQGYIVLSTEKMIISCDTCLTMSVEGVMVKT